MDANTTKILTWEVAEELTGEHIVIPGDYTEIEESAFEAREDIKSVTIPESITAIGAKAFHLCVSLEAVAIPASVTSIGAVAFADCRVMTKIDVDINNPNYSSEDGVLFNKDKTLLIKYPVGKPEKSYVIPSSVTEISNNAFPFCKLEEITIPFGVTRIGRYAFNECNALTNIAIPDSVIEIDGYAFAHCRALSDITLPENLKEISYAMFGFCDSLTSITIPNAVTSIGSSAFWGCISLVDITIPESVTEIKKESFYRCDSLENIIVNENNSHYASEDGVLFTKEMRTLVKIPPGKTGFYSIPESVTEIADGAIGDCTFLEGISFPDTITKIDKGLYTDVFKHCMAMKYVIISANNPKYSSADGVLFNKDKTELIFYPPGKDDEAYIIPNTVTEIKEKAFEGNTHLKSVTISDNVTKIWNEAFSECEGLTEVIIPASVESIAQRAFNQCNSLKNLTISEDNSHYTCENKVLFNKDRTSLIQYFNRKAEDDYIIPDTVTEIEWFAFASCKSLKSVVIPKGVTFIGIHAFEGCDGLTEVVLPNGITSLEYATFSFCKNLKSISIPDSVTDVDTTSILEGYPFYGCKSLTNAMYKGKTYSTERQVCGYGKPYYDLPPAFYDAVGRRTKRQRKNVIEVTVALERQAAHPEN